MNPLAGQVRAVAEIHVNLPSLAIYGARWMASVTQITPGR
jgi:hypothetical protein